MTEQDATRADAYADSVAKRLSIGDTVQAALAAASTEQYGRRANVNTADMRRAVREMQEQHGRIVAVRENIADGITRRVSQRYGRAVGDTVALALASTSGMVDRCALAREMVDDLLADREHVVTVALATAATFKRIRPKRARRMRRDALALATDEHGPRTGEMVAALVAAMLADGPITRPDHDPATCHALVCGHCHGRAAAQYRSEFRSVNRDASAADIADAVRKHLGDAGVRPIGLAPGVRDTATRGIRPTIGRVREETTNRGPEGTTGKAGSVRLIAEQSVLGVLDVYGYVIKRAVPIGDTTAQDASAGHRDRGAEALAALALVTRRGNRGVAVEWADIADVSSPESAVEIARRVAVALADRHDIAPTRVAAAVGEACDAVTIVGRAKREAKRAAVSDAVALAGHVVARRVDRMAK